MKTKHKKELTWDELGNIYDKQHRGRRARTLPFDTIFNWAKGRKDLFTLTKDGGLTLVN